MKELTTDELKKISLNILIEIDDFCKKNNLVYYLSYGTLIGAIRHKGFIPWDDDIDILMKRKDYEFLVKNFQSEIYDIAECHKDKYYYCSYAKAFDKRTTKIEDIRFNKKFEIGVDVDIFPLDSCDEQKDVIRTFKKRKRLIFYKNCGISKISKKFRLKFILRNIASFLFYPYVNYNCKKIDDLNKKHKCDNSNYYFEASSSSSKIIFYDKTFFDNPINVEFEGHNFYTMSKYDEFLRLIYGDYMKLPPIEQQVTHHSFKAYYKEETNSHD